MNEEDIDKLHKVYHDFSDKFMDGLKFNDSGYTLMWDVEKWAAEYPDDVHLITADDGMATSSLMVLIEHKTEEVFYGTTVISIPQNTGNPCELFLSQWGIKELLSALTDIDDKL